MNYKVEMSHIVITCTILFYDWTDSILFDVRLTYFYLSARFLLGIDLLNSHVHVSTSIRDSMVVTHVYVVYSILFIGFLTWADFVIFYSHNFNIILGMTWLSSYHALLN